MTLAGSSGEHIPCGIPVWRMDVDHWRWPCGAHMEPPVRQEGLGLTQTLTSAAISIKPTAIGIHALLDPCCLRCASAIVSLGYVESALSFFLKVGTYWCCFSRITNRGWFSRWGSKLSQKLFVGKEYVVKHIRLKHTHVVDAEREKV